MYNHNPYTQPNYSQHFESEYEQELLPEFEMEEGANEFNNEFEFEHEFESEHDTEYEFEDYAGESEFETQDEFEYDYPYEREEEWEMEGQFGGNDELNTDYETTDFENFGDGEMELEAELEYVSNEQELEAWVNEIAVRDHRTSNIRNAPVGRKAIRQLTKIAAKTLPRIGAAVGWRGQLRKPAKRYNLPSASNPYWRRRPSPSVMRQSRPWYARPLQTKPSSYWNWRKRQWQTRPVSQRPWWLRQPWNYPAAYPVQPGAVGQGNLPMDGGQGFVPPQQQDFPPAPDAGPAPMDSGQTDTSAFMRLVLDTLNNLVRQLSQRPPAGGPMPSDADQIKNALIPAAVAHFPAILQPAQGAPGQQPGSGHPPAAFTGNNIDGLEQQPDSEFEYPMYGEIMDAEDSFNEVTEMELTSKLLSLNSEQEMDYFLDGLFSKALGAVTNFIGSPAGKKLKGWLKKTAKKVLPGLGVAAGNFLGGPLGGQIGGKLAKDVSNLFGLELEGLSPEDSDFETAKAFVRFAGNAAKQAQDHTTGNPTEDVKQAIVEAAKRFAPGMLVSKSQGSNAEYCGQNGYAKY